tara:strand:- start:1956 stop:2174 length:219 start_codon:yes stop_codon:yes gene_type:complete
MIYELECAVSNGRVMRVEGVDYQDSASGEVISFNIVPCNGSPIFIGLDEKQLFQLIGVLHNIQKQLSTKTTK